MRKQSDLSDYTGQLRVEPFVRITDRFNGRGQNEPATVEGNPFPFTVPCAATGDPAIGGDVLAVVELQRDPARLGGRGQARDLGAERGRRVRRRLRRPGRTAFDNTLFARQGVFVP